MYSVSIRDMRACGVFGLRALSRRYGLCGQTKISSSFLEKIMSNQGPIVYIVDDDESIRDSLVRLLETEGLTAKAFSCATDFLSVCDAETRGCILLDIQLPKMSGIELQRWLIDHGVDIPIIFLTGHGDIPLSSQAFRTGALDFLEKPFDIGKLLDRIHEALARDSEQWHNRYRRKQLKESFSRMTPREKEVLKWVAAGYSSKEIAKAMGISNRTIEVHRAHIMEKMKAESLADLISVAMELDKDN